MQSSIQHYYNWNISQNYQSFYTDKTKLHSPIPKSSYASGCFYGSSSQKGRSCMGKNIKWQVQFNIHNFMFMYAYPDHKKSDSKK